MSRPIEALNSFPARPQEAVALFNAALTSELLVNACWEKQKQGGTGLAWPTAYLILPLTLHPETRASLLRSRRITLASWTVKNRDLLADMEYRVASMVPPTKRAIRHGLRVERLGLDGTNLVAPYGPKGTNPRWPEELSSSVKAARLCGKWFNAVEMHMLFEFLGIGG
jgi:hypothetical protein